MPAANSFPGYQNSPISPALSLVAITPSDATDLVTIIRDIRVGDTGGDVTVVTSDGVTVIFKSTLPGEHLGPFAVARVKATGTAATNMVGYI